MAEQGARAYLTADLRLAATKDAAGKGAEMICIPYSKGPQLDFINDLLDRVAVPRGGVSRGVMTVYHHADAKIAQDEGMPYPPFLGPEPVADPACPYCKRRRGDAWQAVQGLEQIDLIGAVLEAIDRIPPEMCGRIVTALAERGVEV